MNSHWYLDPFVVFTFGATILMLTLTVTIATLLGLALR